MDNPALYYSIIKLIGQGGYGKIYLVNKKNEVPLREYALKYVNRPMETEKQ
jgi:serine/threonine protein kinase